jgi:hypothetical protein
VSPGFPLQIARSPSGEPVVRAVIDGSGDGIRRGEGLSVVPIGALQP